MQNILQQKSKGRATLLCLGLLAFIYSGQLFGQYETCDLTFWWGLPAATTDPACYFYGRGISGNNFDSIQVFHLSAGKIFSFLVPHNNNLMTPVIDIVAQAGATPAGGYLHAYLSKAGVQEVVYIDKYHHVIRLFRPRDALTWSKVDLTRRTAGPLAGEGIFGYISSYDNVNRIFYRDRSKLHINLLSSVNGTSWTNTDLTALSGARLPAAGCKLCAYSWGFLPTENIVYKGSNNHICQIYLRNGRWRYLDLSLRSLANILAAGAPFGLETDMYQGQHLFYPAADGHIHALEGNFDKDFWWLDYDVTSASGNPGMQVSPLKQLCAYPCLYEQKLKVVFPDAASKNVYMYSYDVNTGEWIFEDLTSWYGLPQGGSSLYGTYPWGFIDSSRCYFLYKGADKHIYLVRSAQ